MVEKRNHKIKSDYGVRDYYKFYRDNGGTLNYATFSRTLKSFDQGVANIIVNNEYSYKLAQGLGIITVKKVKNYVRIGKDGKVKTNYPVNYNATMKLWATNPEAAKAKKLVRYDNRHSNKYTYRFKYIVSGTLAKYKNKSLYKMRFNRQYLKIPLKNLIFKQGEIERGS